MNREVSFTVYGKPIPQQRHRHNSRCAYDPQKDDKEDFRILMKSHLNQFTVFGGSFLEGPLFLTAKFYFKLPKTKKLREKKGLFFIQRGDIDNLLKFVMDCCQGILFKDDCIIYKVLAVKCYSEKPRTEVTVKEITQADLISTPRTQIKDTSIKENNNGTKKFIPAKKG